MTHFKSSIRFAVLVVFAVVIAICLIAYFFKPTYSVTLNGEFIGYTQNKSELQARINNAIQKGDGENLAFIQISSMPEYQLCLLKRNVQANDDEIYNKIVGQGTSYYRYYAILEDGEEKYYLQNFEDAEKVVKDLKEKESTNSDKISILEKYNTTKAEFTDVETCVAKLYKKKVVTRKYSTGSTGVPPTSVNSSSAKVDLGIGLIRPLSGTVTSRFGARWGKKHKGLDIGAPKGTTIVASASGTVTVSQYGYSGGYGNYIILSHGNGVQTVYGHCTELLVKVGEHVSQGQPIATVGNTGNSQGNHLHLEIRVNGIAQNPQNYVY